ncbi:hypothetical protein [Hymenobacter edaphi]|uniref:Uncharacterized protein n=1 Tax=Hymenobacter edaphi TaxID=2211146 RepID=A0A328BMT8_9BACT|nr:hypothetical protein [Hymenobacter edaphi]RAK68307.1 hypothetical protein DLM85_09785 [Hymenobacter edaphi]
MLPTTTSTTSESIRFVVQSTRAAAAATPAEPAATANTIQPASLAAREQFLAFLALNAHFSTDDLRDLRELLSCYPAAAVYNAVQRACRTYLDEQRTGGHAAAREVQLSKLLLSPLFHFACRTHLPALA